VHVSPTSPRNTGASGSSGLTRKGRSLKVNIWPSPVYITLVALVTEAMSHLTCICVLPGTTVVMRHHLPVAIDLK
jgi:hypothetical protein